VGCLWQTELEKLEKKIEIVEAELAGVKVQLTETGLSEKKEEQLRDEKILLLKRQDRLEEDLRQQQQQAATPAGARALCVCPRVFGFVCWGLLHSSCSWFGGPVGRGVLFFYAFLCYSSTCMILLTCCLQAPFLAPSFLRLLSCATSVSFPRRVVFQLCVYFPSPP
jgi:hypothetical protein